MTLKRLAWTVNDLKTRRARVLADLHPDLLALLGPILEAPQFAPYCGYRGPEDQAKAKASGASNADFGKSPHNFRPALAVDVVLHPSHVRVRPNRQDPDFPDLWDDTTPDAVAAWQLLEALAIKCGLERVLIRDSSGALVRDRPHLQLPNWRARIPQ